MPASSRLFRASLLFASLHFRATGSRLQQRDRAQHLFDLRGNPNLNSTVTLASDLTMDGSTANHSFMNISGGSTLEIQGTLSSTGTNSPQLIVSRGDGT